MTTEVLGFPELTSAQANKFVTYNQNLRRLEAMTIRVLSRTNGGPPSSPGEGDTYIVDVASGDWSGFSIDYIAHYYGGDWYQYEPPEGLELCVLDEQQNVKFLGGSWAASSNSSAFQIITNADSPFSAVPGSKLMVDTSAGTVSVVLPAGPVFNDSVEVFDITPDANVTDGYLDNPIAIDRNGGSIQGIADNLNYNIAGLRREFVFSNTALGWRVES